LTELENVVSFIFYEFSSLGMGIVSLACMSMLALLGWPLLAFLAWVLLALLA
jgi:hypothetical protein